MELCCNVRTVVVHEICPECGEGQMYADYNMPILSSNPPQCGHKCNKCGFTAYYSKGHPYIKHIPIEPLREMTDDEKR